MAQRIQLRRGTAAEWAAANPVLGLGEPGVETDTGKMKLGDGVTAWNSRPYASKGDTGPVGPPNTDASLLSTGTVPDGRLPARLSDGQLSATYAGKADVTPKWKANTAYAAGQQVVSPNGDIVSAKAGFTSGSAYDATKWNGTAAFAPANLSRWKRKLATAPADAKLAFMGDSTSEAVSAAVAIGNRLRTVHTAAGEGLAGMVAANIAQFGYSGSQPAGWWSAYGANVTAFNPDLLVYSLGINAVRLGATTQAQLITQITDMINTIRAALPNTDIILRIPNALTSDDVNANGWVQPNSSAQAYTDILRNTYFALDGIWPNVVIWNAQDRIFGRTSKLKTDYAGLMFDQLHPSQAGYEAIADSLVSDLIGVPRRYIAPAVSASTLAPVDMFTASRGVAPYTVGDLMDRADSATSPGVASSGQAYTVSSGTMGIIGKRMYAAIAGNTRATIESTLANGEFGVNFTTLDVAASTNGLIFRYQDASNYLCFRTNGGNWQLLKIVGGTATVVVSGPAAVNGDRARVVANGTTIQCYVNDVLKITGTITELATATGVGLQMTTTTTRAVDLYARKL